MSTAATINGLTHALPDTSDVEWGGILSSYLAGLAYSRRALFAFGASSGLIAADYVALVPGYAAAAPLMDRPNVTAPFSGVLRRLYVRCRTAPDAQVTVSVVVGNDQSTTAVLSAGTTTASYSSPTGVSIAAGDVIYATAACFSDYTSGGLDLFATFAIEPA